MVLYWIHLSEHIDPKTDGYIGATSRFERRLKEHRLKNSPIKHIVDKFGWDNLIIEVLKIDDDKEFILGLEKKLRPSPNIGWNKTKGGGKPPCASEWSDTTRAKAHIRMASESNPMKNPLISCKLAGDKNPMKNLQSRNKVSMSKMGHIVTSDTKEKIRYTKTKFMFIGTRISDGSVVYLKGQLQMRNAGFDPAKVHACATGKKSRKTHKGYVFTLEEMQK